MSFPKRDILRHNGVTVIYVYLYSISRQWVIFQEKPHNLALAPRDSVLVSMRTVSFVWSIQQSHVINPLLTNLVQSR